MLKAARLAAGMAALAIALVPSAAPAQAYSPAWEAFVQTWSAAAAYTARITMFERRDTQVQNSVLDYTFLKPATASVHFLAGKNSGVFVDWSGGATVVARKGNGLMALMRKTMPLHDPQATTIRGSSIDQLSFSSVIAHALSTPGVVSQEPGPTILDTETVAVTLIPAVAATDTGLTREVIVLAVPTNLPIRILGYQEDTLVRQIDFSDIKLQAK
jgi:outer membrane lipoprotein-sorting protein